MPQNVLKGRCDCGAVSFTVPELPENMNACPCEYCSRVGARWGYFKHDTVVVEGKTETYRRASRTIEFHRCVVCGVVTHWIDPQGRLPHMGANMRNFDTDILAGIPTMVEP